MWWGGGNLEKKKEQEASLEERMPFLIKKLSPFPMGPFHRGSVLADLSKTNFVSETMDQKSTACLKKMSSLMLNVFSISFGLVQVKFNPSKDLKKICDSVNDDFGKMMIVICILWYLVYYFTYQLFPSSLKHDTLMSSKEGHIHGCYLEGCEVFSGMSTMI